jgi:hypothetical protein
MLQPKAGYSWEQRRLPHPVGISNMLHYWECRLFIHIYIVIIILLIIIVVIMMIVVIIIVIVMTVVHFDLYIYLYNWPTH